MPGYAPKPVAEQVEAKPETDQDEAAKPSGPKTSRKTAKAGSK